MSKIHLLKFTNERNGTVRYKAGRESRGFSGYKSSMEKKVLLFDRVQESRKLNPFEKKKKKKEPKATATNVMFCQTI